MTETPGTVSPLHHTLSAATVAADTTPIAEEASRMSTPTIVQAVTQVGTTQVTAKIDQAIRAKIVAIKAEQKALVKERDGVIDGLWVARVANQHGLMLGPGGTAKSFLVRNMAQRITGGRYYERALDESTDVSEVLGSPDIKAMVETGSSRRVLEGTFATATDVFLDEFFNANGVVLHALQPGLNERIVHNDGDNNGEGVPIPLRSCFMGTNKLNSDADQAALWDRVHLRFHVRYIQDRDNLADMVTSAIARLAVLGRGTGTNLSTATTVTLEELDQARDEALALDLDQAVWDEFVNIKDELGGQGIIISDRRVVEGMVAVLSNAWINGHEQVKVGDLDILQHMWWSLLDQQPVARATILQATNPGEKAALDLLDELDKIKAEIKGAASLDDAHKRRIGVEAVRNINRLASEAQPLLDKALAAGASTARIQETLDKADALKVEVGKAVFNIDPTQMNAMTRP